MEYVAFDFETANYNHSSACSLGAVKMRNGEEIGSFYTLIDPEEPFCPVQISIHGITPHHVTNAPLFVEVFNQFMEFVTDFPIISHTSFDRSVIIKANQKNQNIFRTLNYLDSYLLSRMIWKGKYFKYGLKPLANKLGFDFEHHNALSDAKACAHIIEGLIKDSGANSMEELQTKAGYTNLGEIRYDELIRPVRLSGSRGISKLKTSEIKELMSQINIETINKNNPFFQKKIVITGKIGEGISRSECQKAIIELGGEPQNNVGKTSDILIEGIQTASNLKDGFSCSYRKAKELFESGQAIEFMSGEEFLDITIS